MAEELVEKLRPLLDERERVTGDEAAFLARVVELDLGQVPVEPTCSRSSRTASRRWRCASRTVPTWRSSSSAAAR